MKKEIDNLTIGEAKEIASLFSKSGSLDLTKPTGIVDQHGLCIAVLDNGFVYVGYVETDGKYCTIKEAKNIRRWGTTGGLGQLALQGVQPETKLDIAGTVKAPIGELKHLIICEESKWLNY